MNASARPLRSRSPGRNSCFRGHVCLIGIVPANTADVRLGSASGRIFPACGENPGRLMNPGGRPGLCRLEVSAFQRVRQATPARHERSGHQASENTHARPLDWVWRHAVRSGPVLTSARRFAIGRRSSPDCGRHFPPGLYDRPCWSNLGRSATVTICARCGKTLYMSVCWICGTVSAQASLTTTTR
jgi:hypothetical protein